MELSLVLFAVVVVLAVFSAYKFLQPKAKNFEASKLDDGGVVVSDGEGNAVIVEQKPEKPKKKVGKKVAKSGPKKKKES